MELLHNYTNTKCELEVAKTRLDMLLDKKTELYCKYFPLTPTLKEIMVDGGLRNNDKMADYVNDLTKIDDITGKSLEQEITDQRNDVNKLKYYLNLMTDTLQRLTGIEAELYREIVINGNTISKSVEKIAELHHKEPQTIWKYNYNKIKNEIKKLKKYNV